MQIFIATTQQTKFIRFSRVIRCSRIFFSMFPHGVIMPYSCRTHGPGDRARIEHPMSIL